MESANRVSVDFPPRHSPGPVVTVFGDNDAIDKWRIDAQSRIRFNPSTSMYLTAQLQLPNRVNLSPIKGAGFSVLKEIERAHGVNLDLPRASGDPIKALGTERDIKRVTKQLSQMLGTTITVGSVSGGGSSNQTGAIGASLKNLVVDPYKKIDFDFKETNMIIETLFFPDDDSVPPAGFPGTKGNWKYDRFLQYIKSTTKTLDIAIYNLTYDRTRDALLELHKKGVKVRIVGCASNIDSEGNDIRELASAGVKVTILDLAKPGTKAGSSSYNKHSDAFLMHHKFAILDGKLALNGSFNWSKSAAFGNHENIVFSNIPTFVEPFKQHFEKIYAAGKPLK